MWESKVDSMRTHNLEDDLRNLKFTHPTDVELTAYCDQELDPMRRARVELHVKECFRCEKELALLLEESAALSHGHISAEDVALVERLVERLMEQTELTPKPSSAGLAETAKEIPLRERMEEYLRQMLASWQICFGQGALRGGPDEGEEVWRWQSEDGNVQARATIEKNADLTIHFSTNQMALEGARLNIRLGALSQEIILRQVSESEVEATVVVPWRQRPRDMADISIESV